MALRFFAGSEIPFQIDLLTSRAGDPAYLNPSGSNISAHHNLEIAELIGVLRSECPHWAEPIGRAVLLCVVYIFYAHGPRPPIALGFLAVLEIPFHAGTPDAMALPLSHTFVS
jgi:hypothetical protein